MKISLDQIRQYSAGSETKTRVVTAVAGVSILLLLLIFGGHLGASIITAFLTAGIAWEVSGVFYHRSDAQEKKKVLLGTAWLIVFINLLFTNTILECAVAAFVGLFTYYLVTAERHPDDLKDHFNEFIFTVFVLFYVVLLMQYLPLLRRGPNGVHWVILFLLINWGGDSAAYFVGRKHGKRKLYPVISPKKTVEGALGGLAGSVVAALLYKFIFFHDLGFFAAILVALIIGVFSQIGDLCESFFKRAYGVKDTGSILPGHGGILDRFDGVLFTLPIMVLCARIF